MASLWSSPAQGQIPCDRRWPATALYPVAFRRAIWHRGSMRFRTLWTWYNATNLMMRNLWKSHMICHYLVQSRRWASSSRVHLFTRSRKDACVKSVCERWGQADDAFDSCHRCHAVSWTNASRRARLLLWLDVLRSVAAGSMQVLSPKHAADNGDDTISHTITLPVGVSPQTSA